MANQIPRSFLDLDLDVRYDSRSASDADPLWSVYFPIRTAIENWFRDNAEGAEDAILEVVKANPPIKYSLNTVLDHLDAFVLYTPDSMEQLRIHQLRAIGIAKAGGINTHLLGKVVFVIHKALKAVATRTGSAPACTINTDDWLARMTEFVDPSISSIVDTINRPVICESSDASSDGPPAPREDPGECIKRDINRIEAAKTRDHHRCVITGKPLNEVAHIIPFSCGNFSEYFDQHMFWAFLKLFHGDDLAKAVWDFVGAKNINKMENLITLSPDTHGSIAQSCTILTPVRAGPATANHSTEFKWLGVKVVELDPTDILPATIYAELPSNNLERMYPTYQSRKNTGWKRRLLNDGEVVVIYTEKPVNLPLPSMELLGLMANITRLIWHVKVDGKRLRGELEKISKPKRQGKGGSGSVDGGNSGDASGPSDSKGSGSKGTDRRNGKRRRKDKGGSGSAKRHRGQASSGRKHGTAHVDLELVNERISPYAYAQQVGIRIPTHEDMQYIRAIQRACSNLSEENEEYPFDYKISLGMEHMFKEG